MAAVRPKNPKGEKNTMAEAQPPIPPDDEEEEGLEEEPREQNRPGIPPKVDYQKIQAEREQRIKPGYFTIYKKGQGYWTRMGTLGGAAIIGLLAAQFLYSNLRTTKMMKDPTEQTRTGLLLGVLALFLAIYAAVVYHITNRPTIVEFLISTDSEMKKVNWSTREELIGSTKVVIFFVVLIAICLFAYDTIFSTIFFLMHVLKSSPLLHP